MTTREQIAAMILQAFAGTERFCPDQDAWMAVQAADKLLSELERTDKKRVVANGDAEGGEK